MEREILTFQQAKEFTGYSTSHFYRLCAKGIVPHYSPGRKLFFKKSELETWMLQTKVKPENF
jgi:excisionase family DNA binding protein